MRLPRPPISAILSLLAALLVMSSCGASASVTRPATPTATPTPVVHMMRVAASRSVSDSHASGPVTTSASCPAGQNLLSGGYALAGSAQNQYAYVLEDYPASLSTWSVTEANPTGGSLTLTVYADCLQATFPVTTQIVVGTQTLPRAPYVHTAQCPAGTTVTGGGYRDYGYSSAPDPDPAGNGWQAYFFIHPNGGRVYAVCVSRSPSPYLQFATTVTKISPVAPGGSATLSLTCPAGLILVGGGERYGGPPTSAVVNAPTSDFTTWQVKLTDQSPSSSGASYNLVAIAVCAQIV